MEIEQIEPNGENHTCEFCNIAKAITYVTHKGSKKFLCRSCWESIMSKGEFKEEVNKA